MLLKNHNIYVIVGEGVVDNVLIVKGSNFPCWSSIEGVAMAILDGIDGPTSRKVLVARANSNSVKVVVRLHDLLFKHL